MAAFCSRESELALGELFAAARLVEADLFTLNFTCITGNKTSLGKRRLQCCIVLDQRTGDTVTDSTRHGWRENVIDPRVPPRTVSEL